MELVPIKPRSTDIDLAVDEQQNPFIVIAASGERHPIYKAIFDCKIVQPSSIGIDPNITKDMIGQFVFPDLGIVSQELKLLPIWEYSPTRALFPAYDKKQSDVAAICMSMDMKTPSSRIASPVSPKCAELNANGYLQPVCPKAIWGDNKEAPECFEQVQVVFLDLENMIPIKLRFKKTALAAWREFKRTKDKKREIARIKGQPLGAFYLKASLSNEGTYYELKLEPETDAVVVGEKDKVANYYIDIFTEMANRWKDRGTNTQGDVAALEAEAEILEEDIAIGVAPEGKVETKPKAKTRTTDDKGPNFSM